MDRTMTMVMGTDGRQRVRENDRWLVSDLEHVGCASTVDQGPSCASALLHSVKALYTTSGNPCAGPMQKV